MDADILKSSLQDTNYMDLLSYVDTYIEELKEDQRYWERKHFKVVKCDLIDYLDGISISVEKMDTEFLEGFQRYLLTEAGHNEKNKGNSPNTVRKKLQRLLGMIKVALKNKDIKQYLFAIFDPVENRELTIKPN